MDLLDYRHRLCSFCVDDQKIWQVYKNELPLLTRARTRKGGDIRGGTLLLTINASTKIFWGKHLASPKL